MQGELFSSDPRVSGPEGWASQPGFLSPSEEGELLAWIEKLPLSPMRYKEYVARRRGISFGGHLDFDANRLMPSPAIPREPMPLLHKAAAWLGQPPESFIHVLIAEYRPGAPLGWHRDVPDFEDVVGVSLAGEGELELRRYRRARFVAIRWAVVSRHYRAKVHLLHHGNGEMGWQHAVVASRALRYSITMRTPRQRPSGATPRA
jgi:alkylated DNA repair dioxygenase AlkB